MAVVTQSPSRSITSGTNFNSPERNFLSSWRAFASASRRAASSVVSGLLCSDAALLRVPVCGSGTGACGGGVPVPCGQAHGGGGATRASPPPSPDAIPASPGCGGCG
eukprot:CAMPEP_0202754166 /NCGR_PEP_ID=MMETSP1388-20130828/14105_1 /ASSEMBLY_ACC=CAM_ASM_000864 /TAXON_ID=37098 /ORGANISM="Isochrysis sp, Strain CCMP1244" /LENGTH=106 /DNA_ID=CAMNT_0049421939 /DNA_START=550 /DNA_END=866 /DNA_ORIENTATION=+